MGATCDVRDTGVATAKQSRTVFTAEKQTMQGPRPIDCLEHRENGTRVASTMEIQQLAPGEGRKQAGSTVAFSSSEGGGRGSGAGNGGQGTDVNLLDSSRRARFKRKSVTVATTSNGTVASGLNISRKSGVSDCGSVAKNPQSMVGSGTTSVLSVRDSPADEAAEAVVARASKMIAAGTRPNGNEDGKNKTLIHQGVVRESDIVGASNICGTSKTELSAGATAANYDGTTSLSIETSPDTKPVPPSDPDVPRSQEWSEQFRDRKLLEDNERRKTLFRQLVSQNHEEDSAGAGGNSGTATAGGEPSGHGAVLVNGIGGRGSGSGGGLRSVLHNGSGSGASLGEFKASVGLSAKGELFEDLFCRPSCLDEALTTEPGKRTPEQASGVLSTRFQLGLVLSQECRVFKNNALYFVANRKKRRTSFA